MFDLYKDKCQHKKYIFMFLLFLCLFTLPILINFIILKNSGEYISIEEVFNEQSKDETILYGSALLDTYKDLKLYMITQKKPKIIALGSSRVLQFRQSFFSKNFFNMGSMVSDINEALNVTDFILQHSRPKVVIFGVDFWWFNEKVKKLNYELQSNNKLTFSLNKYGYEPAHLLLPFQWLKDKKISLEQYANLLLFNTSDDVGITGKLRKTGFAGDGSYYYTHIVTNSAPQWQDKHFYQELERVRNSESYFEDCPYISKVHYSKFIELVDRYKKNDIKLILFLPPLAFSLNNEMKKHNFNCIASLKKRLAKDHIPIYDFTEAEKHIKTSNCEFVDGFHGGDVLYAKILKYLNSKENILTAYVNEKYIDTISNQFNGFAMIPNPKITLKKETDFLDENCPKLAQI